MFKGGSSLGIYDRVPSMSAEIIHTPFKCTEMQLYMLRRADQRNVLKDNELERSGTIVSGSSRKNGLGNLCKG